MLTTDPRIRHRRASNRLGLVLLVVMIVGLVYLVGEVAGLARSGAERLRYEPPTTTCERTTLDFGPACR